MGSVFSSQETSTPTTNLVNYVDEIAGVEQVPVRNADGTITYYTREIEKSEEEKLKDAELEGIKNSALEQIQALSSADYELSSSAKDALNSYRNESEDSLNSSYTERKESEEDYLAKRGLGDSTAGDTLRRQTKLDEFDANNSLDNQVNLLKGSIRDSELSIQQNLYGLASDELNYDTAKTLQAAQSGLSSANAINSANYASVNDYYNNANNYAANSQFLNTVLNPLSNTINNTGGFVSSLTSKIF